MSKKYKITKKQTIGLLVATISAALCITNPGSKVDHSFDCSTYDVKLQRDYSLENIFDGCKNDKYTLSWPDSKVTYTREQLTKMTTAYRQYISLSNGKTVNIKSEESILPTALYYTSLSGSIIYTLYDLDKQSSMENINLIRPNEGLDNQTISSLKKKQKKYNKKRH